MGDSWACLSRVGKMSNWRDNLMMDVRMGRSVGMPNLNRSTGIRSMALDLIGELEISSSTSSSVRTTNSARDETA